MFDSVDKFFRAFMKKMYYTNNILKIACKEGRLLESLKKQNHTVEII